MAKIAFYEVEDWEKDYLKKKLPKHNLIFNNGVLTDDNIVKDADALAVFIYSKVSKDVVSRIKNLKFVATMSTGYDHIDLRACKARKVLAANVPSYGENTVAEHAMALLLNISRKIYDSVERTRRGNWNLDGLRGFDLKGKTAGIIGTGRIGKHFANYCKAFGMRVICFDKFQSKDWAKENGFAYVPLNKLLSKSDVISLHLPYLPETKHTINKRNVRKIKKGCVIINTARGGLIETDALVAGIDQGIIKAFGADVLEEESLVKDDKTRLSLLFKRNYDMKTVLEDHALIEQDNVFITPHNAFNSQEALMRILDTTVDNINGFLKKKPVNIVK